MVAQAALLGQKGAYYHKWLVHRRLRPECFAGRIEVHLTRRCQGGLSSGAVCFGSVTSSLESERGSFVLFTIIRNRSTGAPRFKLQLKTT
jgi:hypothetical protein